MPGAKLLIQHLEGTAQGGSFEMEGLFPGLPDKLEVVILEEHDRMWVVQLIALGVSFSKMTIIETKGELIMEESK
jgi:hypothetical protein